MTMEITNNKLKTFSLKVYTEEELNILEEFQKLAVYNETTPTDELLALMADHNSKIRPKDKTIVTEGELLEKLKNEGFHTNKPLLVKYRREGYLKDEDGKWWWNNSSSHVVYWYEKIESFIIKRSKNPKSRIGQ